MGNDIKLAIFNRFKTKQNQMTGEATRQCMIIATLANKINPADRTRTGIAQRIATEKGLLWKNIYSGIFRDLDEVMLPIGIVEEEGRLPLKRGPKALQEKGIPYYRLTREGVLISLSLDEVKNKGALLRQFFEDASPDERRFAGILDIMIETSPMFVGRTIRMYVRSFCEGRMDGGLLPFDLTRLRGEQDDFLRVQKEIMDAFVRLPGDDRAKMVALLSEAA